MINRLMWVYFVVNWVDLEPYAILLLTLILLQSNQCKIIGEGGLDF